MKYITLTDGTKAKVDDDMYDELAAFNWTSMRPHGNTYAVRYAQGKLIYMHRVVVECAEGDEVDHINRNGLDNRRENLRVASHSQNLANRRRQKNNKSGYKGVSPVKGGWRVKVGQTYIGRFQDAEEAARAYDKAARAMFGEFANVNFPEEHNQ